VDDGSTDNSLAILEKLAKEDNRIKIIKHKENLGLLCARKSAVSSAIGSYIMFVDSDDSIEPNTCKILKKHICSKKAEDIIAFNNNVVNLGKNNEEAYNNALNYFKPKLKSGLLLFKEKIFSECFINKSFSYNVWNKVYKSELCKKVYDLLPNERIVWAEDLYATQYLYYFAKNFKYINKKLYNYSFGNGISTTRINYNKFANNLLNDIEYITRFQNHLIEKEQKNSSYYKIAEIKKEETISNIINMLLNECCADEISETLNKLFDVSDVNIINILRKTLNTNYEKLAEIFHSLNICNKKKKTVKNIGIFYHRLTNGGIERVISKLSPLFLNSGYNVTVFVEKKTQDDYVLDDKIKIEIIPTVEPKSQNEANRYDAWKDLILKYNIDTMMYQASTHHYLFYDLIFCKMMGLNFITTAHEFLSQGMCYNDILLKQRTVVMKNVDLIQTLSRTEEKFWQNLGVNAKYIPNPLTFNPTENEIASKENKTIIWVGRFDSDQKNPKDAIDIMKIIHQQDKNIKMIMMGKGETKQIDDEIKNYIKTKGLTDVIENKYDNEMKKYYQKASVLLMTSTYESAPMVLGEAMSFGLPCVIYDMPYLEFARENKGVISVRQRDIFSAAKTLKDLLDNQKQLKEKGYFAKIFVENFAKIDIINEWKKAFIQLANKTEPKPDNIYNQIIEEVIFEHYIVGIKRANNNNYPLSFFARAKRCLKVNGIWGTFKKVIKKIIKKGLKIIKKIFRKKQNN